MKIQFNIMRININLQEEFTLSEVTLERQQLGFGFRIVGGTEEGSQVTVGHIVPGGAADGDHRIATGDEIASIDGHNVVSTEFVAEILQNYIHSLYEPK